MTRRLYYHDATMRVFTARVLEREVIQGEDGKPHPAVRLDQTAFYPTSGGQPYDRGSLENVPVIEVVEDAEGNVWHLLAAPLSAEHVRGEIDWARRFDHMQQHTGQHLLSAAFEDLLSARTVGFHLGREDSTIDLSIPDLDWDAVFTVESAVNGVIWENRPITVRIVDEDDIGGLALRKPLTAATLEVHDEIRVIEIEGYDASACGGTHVRATGAIGLVKVTGIEHYKGGVRVAFRCGARALQNYQRALEVLRVSGATLSVGMEEVPAAIARLEEEAKTARRDLRQAQSELVAYESERLWAKARIVDDVRVVAGYLPDRSFSAVRALTSQLREHPRTVILLAVTEEQGVRLVCARSDDLAQLDAVEMLRDALGPLGGRGGGAPTLAQGGGPERPPEEIQAVLQQTLVRHNLSD